MRGVLADIPWYILAPVAGVLLVVIAFGLATLLHPSVAAAKRYAIQRGGARFAVRRHRTIHRGVAVTIVVSPAGTAERSGFVVSAVVPVPTGARLAVEAHDAVPVDDVEVGDAWRWVGRAHPSARLTSDGAIVTLGVIGHVLREEVIHAMVETVAAVAHWDDGLTATLLGLPGARELTEHTLRPCVVLAPDELTVGVRDGVSTVARVEGRAPTDGVPAHVAARLRDAGEATLDVEGQGVRLTWPHVERDAAKLRAGVDALRALVGGAAPYR